MSPLFPLGVKVEMELSEIVAKHLNRDPVVGSASGVDEGIIGRLPGNSPLVAGDTDALRRL